MKGTAPPRALIALLDNVSRCYQRGAERVLALDSVSFGVYRGEFVVLVGPSGSGKSTLLHLMAGLDRPTGGTVKLDARLVYPRGDPGAESAGEFVGVDVAELREEDLARLRRREIGLVFQSFHLLPTLTAVENAALPLLLEGLDETRARARATELVEQLGLAGRSNHFPDELSGGERQRVAIARALSADPALLLCDEPTGNLDSVQGGKIVELLRAMVDTESRTVVMVTHDRVAAERADRVLELHDGRLRE